MYEISILTQARKAFGEPQRNQQRRHLRPEIISKSNITKCSTFKKSMLCEKLREYTYRCIFINERAEYRVRQKSLVRR